ncbi:MAG: hypothetical protein PHN31_02575 [Candidatus Gracilibacteria bacterium]|nr:hypothetical protein [Candidatus Gracilibacteria bacterium]
MTVYVSFVVGLCIIDPETSSGGRLWRSGGWLWGGQDDGGK